MANIMINGLSDNIGAQTEPFDLEFTVDSDSKDVGNISVNASVDGDIIYHSDTVSQGTTIKTNVDPTNLKAGDHTISVTATKSGYEPASANVSFMTTSLILPNGKITQFQDYTGSPIYPQTVASAIQGANGESLDSNLQKLITALLYNQANGTITDYSGTVIDLVEKYNLVTANNINDIPGLVTEDNISTIPGTVKIQTGSYTGTGTYGPSNPCTLTFDFEPDILFVIQSSSNNTVPYQEYTGAIYQQFPVPIAPLILCKNLLGKYSQTSILIATSGYSRSVTPFNVIYLSEFGKTVTWYAQITSGGPSYISNVSQYNSYQIYDYVAIGAN